MHPAPALLVTATSVVLAGCGGDGGTTSSDDVATQVSARFAGRTSFDDGTRDTTRGAFDWNARRGWGTTSMDGFRSQVIQIGDTCYRRFNREAWKKTRADDVDEICDPALFSNPATSDDLLRQIADSWTRVGEEVVGGVRTTHFRGHVNVGALQSTFDEWVDADGQVRRERDVADDGGYVTVRRYYDFGTRVQVKPPVTK
jgi:hypothetical protein